MLLPAPRGAKFVRRGPGLLAEKTGEVRGVGEGETVGDLVDGLAGEHELTLGFGEHALADQMAGSDAGCALDVVVEAIDRHRQLIRVEGELPLFVKVLFDELAQRIDGCAGRLERDRIASPARASGRQPRHLDRYQREQSAHRDTKTGPGEKPLLVQL